MSDQLPHEKSPETKNANALRDTLAQRIHQQINDVTASAPQKITLDEGCSLVQISRATIYRRIKSGTFPAPVKVPSNAARIDSSSSSAVGPVSSLAFDRAVSTAWAGASTVALPPPDLRLSNLDTRCSILLTKSQ